MSVGTAKETNALPSSADGGVPSTYEEEMNGATTSAALVDAASAAATEAAVAVAAAAAAAAAAVASGADTPDPPDLPPPPELQPPPPELPPPPQLPPPPSDLPLEMPLPPSDLPPEVTFPPPDLTPEMPPPMSAAASTQGHPQAPPAQNTTGELFNLAPQMPHETAAAAASSSSQVAQQPATTPIGTVVEPGQEHTGRWTKEEHELFLSALKQYGKEWKKVAAKVKTRTVVQTRTHAQKYFQKLAKAMNSGDAEALGGEMMDVMVGANVDSLVVGGIVGGSLGQKANAIRKAAKEAASVEGSGKTSRGKKGKGSGTSSEMSTSSGTASSAKKLLAPKALAPLQPMPTLSAPAPPPSTAMNPSYLSTSGSLFKTPKALQAPPPQTPAQPPNTVVASEGQSGQMHHTIHGSGTTAPPGTTVTKTPSSSSSSILSPMRIVAPASDMMNPSGMPPPSPAACGKRKLAEIAAAQMLAGVMRSGGGPPSEKKSVAIAIGAPSVSGSSASNFPTPSSALESTEDRYNNDAMDPASAGRETPPPPIDAPAPSSTKDHGNGSGRFETPTTSPFRPSMGGFGSSLQIVNPDSLGGSMGGIKRGRTGGASPTTPWDGQLKALVSEVKSKEAAASVAAAFAGKQVDDGTTCQSGDVTNTEGDEDDDVIDHPLTNTIRSSLHLAVCHGDIDEVTRILNNPEEEEEAGGGGGIDSLPPLPFTGGNASMEGVTGPTGALHPRTVSRGTADDAGGDHHPPMPMQMPNIMGANDNFDQSQEPSFSRKDTLGFTPLHSAACLNCDVVGQGIPAEMTRLLLSVGADVRCTDRDGNTALHWGSRSGNSDVAHLLTLRNCPLDAQNDYGETALHWAMRAGRKGQSTVRVLVEDGARNNVFNKRFRRPLDVAACGFNFSAETNKGKKSGGNGGLGAKGRRSRGVDVEVLQERRECRANLLSTSPNSRTLVLHHPECNEHVPKSESDWECPDRIKSILAKLTESRTHDTSVITGVASPATPLNPLDLFRFPPREITVSSDFDRASLELISRVHSAEYLSFVNDLSKQLERKIRETDGMCPSANASVPFTPHVQRKVLKGKGIKENSHSDTSFSVGSLRAARRAAGSVQHAVDSVLSGRFRNAFCIVRPPGHHAGVNGLLEDSESCGFCIFNNVAAGAMHALSERHSSRCERVAIVDVDVHHGNGTEEIVRRAHDPTRIFFFSVHLYDNANANGSSSGAANSGGWHFYPGTGDKDDMAHNIINVPIAPLWKEKEVLAATTGSGSASNVVISNYNTRPRNKQKSAAVAAALRGRGAATDSAKEPGSAKSSDTEADLSDGTSSRRSTSSQNAAPAPPAYYLLGTGQRAFRRAIRSRLLPALRAFNPDLILISLGLDASRGDVGNAKHMTNGRQKMGLDLDPEDYAWATRKIMEVADICCQGRAVSVLEGGYGKTPKDEGRSTRGTNRGDGNKKLLDKAVFSECAMQHLRALIDPYDAEGQSGRQLDSSDEED